MYDILKRVAIRLDVEAAARTLLGKYDGEWDEADDDSGVREARQVLADEVGLDFDDIDEDWLADHLPFEDALDIEIKGSKSIGGEWNIEGIEVHLATGGPGYWIEYDGSHARLRGAWWGDTACVSLSESVESMLAHVWELATENY